MSALEVASLLRDGVVAGAVVIGVWVVASGLNTWERQLSGGREYGMARRVLIVVLKARDALRPEHWQEMHRFESDDPGES